MTTYNTPPDMLLRAVDGVLHQAEKRLVLMVVNDGGDPACWDVLAHIQDPRLQRINMPANAGTYACHAETLRRCRTPWWSPHDSDDYVSSDRYQALLAQAQGADVVLGGYLDVNAVGKTTVRMPQPRHSQKSAQIVYASVWAGGLWRTEWLRRAGGVNGSFRVGYDSALQTLALRFGRVRLVQHSGYTRVQRAASLTVDPATGIHSPYRTAVYACLDEVLERALAAPTLDGAGAVMAAAVFTEAAATPATGPDACL